MDELLERCCETLELYKELGNDVITETLGRLLCNPERPNVYDANHGAHARAREPEEIDQLLARADEAFANCQHRRWSCDPLTPPEFEARLVLLGYAMETTLQLVLEGELRAALAPRALPCEIRMAKSDADWEVLYQLHREDHIEEALKADRAVYTERTSRGLTESKRPKAPDLRFWIARVDGADCAFFSSMPGRNGVGLVEDLFTLPAFRHRGIASALIAHSVADARARGAGPVLIGAEPEDTPKSMYAAMGFRPAFVTRNYLKRFGS